jgi:hypothetical protein
MHCLRNRSGEGGKYTPNKLIDFAYSVPVIEALDSKRKDHGHRW